MPMTVYREPTQQMRNKFERTFGRIKKTIEGTLPEDIAVRDPGEDTHFRDTDIGARIEWTDGKMVYWLILDARRIQDNER